MPLLSIIMPVFGVEDFIAHAIESVISQIFEDWELIIVNDGTKDMSAEIARKYEKIDNRITVYDKVNGGLSDARNFGLKYAVGQYIHFFDSDDYIDKNYYCNMVDKANGCDILISGYIVDSFDSNGNIKYTEKHIKEPGNTPEEWVLYLSGFLNFAWNKLFRRDFLIHNSLKFERGLKYIEDCEFMSRVLGIDPNMEMCNVIGYHYRNDNRNTLSREFDQSLIKLSQRRISCSNIILSKLISDKNLVDSALNIVKFNVIRFLLHAIFSFGEQLNKEKKIELIKDILCSKSFDLNHNLITNSFFEKVLYNIYVIKNLRLVYFLYKLIK